jgi:predicted 2-oxoglutarate/Fe(II)-dependent dioxygenase YbiX
VTITPHLERFPITEFIYQYEHRNFSDSLINSILDFTSTQNVSCGTIGGGIQDRDVRNVSILNITDSFDKYDDTLSVINECLYDYLCQKTYNNFVGLPLEFNVEVLQYLKYKPGGHYVPHVDKFYGCAGTQGDRVFTALLYLNDDYAGGSLKFPYFKTQLKPKKGSILIFPSTWEYCHCVEPVYRGERHSMVSWFLDANLQ